MLRQFKITVDGKAYQVSVEETTAGAAPVASVPVAPAPAASAPAPAPTPAAAPAAAAPAATGAGDVASPLAGTVVEVHVKAGDSVSAGQTVVTLEAMKMNTPVSAPSAGTVQSVAVQAGNAVAEGQVLLSIG